jgi:hypothetical protein
MGFMQGNFEWKWPTLNEAAPLCLQAYTGIPGWCSVPKTKEHASVTTGDRRTLFEASIEQTHRHEEK